jgi:hypothetical protein
MGLGLSTPMYMPLSIHNSENIKKQSSSVITVIQPQDYVYVLTQDDKPECFSVHERDIRKALEKYKNKLLVSSLLYNESPYSDDIDENTVYIYSRSTNQPLYNKGTLVTVLKIIKVPFYLSKIIGM